MHDVVVIGGGPAGLALARSLTDRSTDVLVVSTDTVWHATYGAWRDDVAECELGAPLNSLIRGAWPTVRVVGAREQLIARPYIVFDNGRLRDSLARGVNTLADEVEAVEHGVEHSSVRVAGGQSIDARLVIDATGSGVFLAKRGEPAGAQTAYGVVVDSSSEFARRAVPMPESFTLMDWSLPPTFLYSAKFNDGSCLIEETSLFAQPPHSIDELRVRLAERLGLDGTEQAIALERVNIPMGEPLPLRTTRVVGFGAAAGFIHPVTGYSVAASLRAAPRVAESIRTSVIARRMGSDLAKDAWESVWPAHYLRTRGWHVMGLSVLRSLPKSALPKFFDAFFDLPTQLSAAYLRIDSNPGDVRSAMLGVFKGVDSSTRLKLMSSPGALLRALAAR
jgi:lycopene beta-cyclase